MFFWFGFLFNFFSEVQMYTHLRFAYNIVILLLTYSTALKEQLTFLKYPIWNKASCEAFKLIIFKNISVLYYLNSRKYLFLLAWVYFVFHFDWFVKKFFVH